jgi:hypothetical protein
VTERDSTRPHRPVVRSAKLPKLARIPQF